MKYFFLLLGSLAVGVCLHAQARVQKDSLVVSDSAFVRVETESSFPGGAAGWSRFLGNNMVYPEKAVRQKVQGTVVVQFIVDKDGSISDIEAISGPPLLQAAAVSVVKLSPNWKPAVQDGRKVKSYKKQPITFRLQ